MAELFLKRMAIERPPDGWPRDYAFGLPAVRRFGERRLTAPVTVFVGENGSGKSTLLEALAVALGLNAEGGSKNLRFVTRATHSELHGLLRVTRAAKRPRDAFFLRAESYYNVATAIDELDEDPDNVQFASDPPIRAAYGGTSLHRQSHGESFLTLFFERLRGPGIYLMDEPEAALSPQRQLALLARMHQLVRAGSQFLFATHAPILMAYPGADVWHFGKGGVRAVAATETDHWCILRRFLAEPTAMLDELLRE